jgi:hypothetical protein
MKTQMAERASWRKSMQSPFGWIFAAFIVAVALFGPPLTGQNVPNLVELRHDVLMIDREFERWSLRTGTTFAGSSILVQNDPSRAGDKRPKAPFGGGVS